jgi:formylglycine-generating enzyme required for sulfatase activity
MNRFDAPELQMPTMYPNPMYHHFFMMNKDNSQIIRLINNQTFRGFVNFVEIASGVPFEMIAIKGGSYKIGSGPNQNIETTPPYAIAIKDFYVGKTEVSIAEFKAFVDATGYKTDAEKNVAHEGSSAMTETSWEQRAGVDWRCDVYGNLRNASEFNHPVVHVSWNDAKAYCVWLSTKSGKNYRLLSESEWEYAAGGGATNRTKWAGTSNEAVVDDYVVSAESGPFKTEPVKSRKPNTLGLYDMSGNVWEWCEDDYNQDYNGIPKDGSARMEAERSRSRVIRGGSWYFNVEECRVAVRNSDEPNNRNYILGFRVAADM